MLISLTVQHFLSDKLKQTGKTNLFWLRKYGYVVKEYAQVDWKTRGFQNLSRKCQSDMVIKKVYKSI